MLFNTYIYFALFLPITIVIYFYLNKWKITIVSRSWLILCSLFFYSWWDVRYLSLIIFSILFNFTIGTVLGKKQLNKKPILFFGIIVNVGLLGFFKYTDFLIANINTVIASGIKPLNLLLPLAISFFTFQQITYLVDSYRGETKEHNFLNYALFVSFFPQLIAGPIVHHKEMMPQFQRTRNKLVNYRNLASGLYIFVIGLFKKVLIADSLSPYVAQSFDAMQTVTFVDAWVASLAYTFQIYFDFSGYMDMAMGSALMLNIKLPINFDSPYKSLSVREFWRRWHITLGRFLREHVYIPLGGSRKTEIIIYSNLMITFLVGGLWHGAGWTFVFWGFLHGLAVVVNRVWAKTGIRLNKALAWFLTFNFLNFSWVFFRANTWDDAIKIIRAMTGFSDISFHSNLRDKIYIFEILHQESADTTVEAIIVLLILLLIVTLSRNTHQLRDNFIANNVTLVYGLTLGFISFICMDWVGEFLYFNF